MKYKDSGVDINLSNILINKIKFLSQHTKNKNVLSNIGGFCSLFEIPILDYCSPILVSSTDGVGTKLKFAYDMNIYDNIGIDLVAMCVNDIIVSGAKPLFFLDYYATGKFVIDNAYSVISSISRGCEQAHCSLIGGESAEMPYVYDKNKFDLAGFCVGIVDKNKIIDSHKVKPGDKIIALKSSGLHSNGYSLLHKIIYDKKIKLDYKFNNFISIRDILMTPTKIYVDLILDLIKNFDIHAIAHITGGGLTYNIPRILPAFTCANIILNSWNIPSIFCWIQETGGIEWLEMFKTYNCGIGMILIINALDVEAVSKYLHIKKEIFWEIGVVKTFNDNNHKNRVFYYNE